MALLVQNRIFLEIFNTWAFQRTFSAIFSTKRLCSKKNHEIFSTKEFKWIILAVFSTKTAFYQQIT